MSRYMTGPAIHFTIPRNIYDSIATLEITVADCAQSPHIGYAYIDGICEPCNTSALGLVDLNTIDYMSCDHLNTPVAKVCGKISLPTINNNCNSNNPDTWNLVNITVPGYIIENLQIYSNNTFCFDFPMTNFTAEDCLEIYAEATFSNGTDIIPPQLSNSLEICRSQYEIIDCSGGEVGTVDTCGVVIDVKVGGCNDNSTTTNISDDYYYVYVSLYDPDSIGWRLDRDLLIHIPMKIAYILSLLVKVIP